MSSYKQIFAPKIRNFAYLIPPIKDKFTISEGFIYSRSEHNTHKIYIHKGIDYTCPYGTPVYAAAAGYAVASYHRRVMTNPDGTVFMYHGKPMGMGFGYFVQIYHSEKVCKVEGGRITQYGHLSKIASAIRIKTMQAEPSKLLENIKEINNRKRSKKLSSKQLLLLLNETRNLMKKYPWLNEIYGFHGLQPSKKKLALNAYESYLYTLPELEKLHRQKNQYVTWVEHGELIGFVGTSGIVHGELQYKEGQPNYTVKQYKIWDDAHLHFEEAAENAFTYSNILMHRAELAKEN